MSMRIYMGRLFMLRCKFFFYSWWSFGGEDLLTGLTRGLHTGMFTPMAFIARSAGILAHWRESMLDAPCIWRPRLVYA